MCDHIVGIREHGMITEEYYYNSLITLDFKFKFCPKCGQLLRDETFKNDSSVTCDDIIKHIMHLTFVKDHFCGTKKVYQDENGDETIIKNEVLEHPYSLIIYLIKKAEEVGIDQGKYFIQKSLKDLLKIDWE